MATIVVRRPTDALVDVHVDRNKVVIVFDSVQVALSVNEADNLVNMMVDALEPTKAAAPAKGKKK